MKVSSTSSTTSTAASSGAKPAAEGFGDLLNVSSTAPRAAAWRLSTSRPATHRPTSRSGGPSTAT